MSAVASRETISSVNPEIEGGEACQDPAVLAAKALKLAQTYETPPVPKVFAVWFAYASGRPAALCAKLKKLLLKSQTLDPYALEQLHIEFLETTEHLRRSHQIASRHLDEEVQQTVKLLEQHINSNTRLDGCLKRTSSTLENSKNPVRIRQAVELLLNENGKMRVESAKLNHRLEQTRSKIRKLSQHLQHARNNEFKDPLTGVANRRYLDRCLPHLINEAQASGSPLCLVMADIDHFKRINDTFGHQVGDDVLRFFSGLLKKSVKGRDVVARYGGEEFAVVLPATSMVNARGLVERFMQELAGSELVVANGKIPVGKLTSSFGIALAGSKDSADALIKRADEKLYEAKSTGRNRVRWDAGPAGF